MKLFIEWGRPVPLRDGSRQNLIYVVDLKKLPQVPGLYILGRRWGKEFEARGGSRIVIPGTRLRRHEVHSSGKHPKKLIPRVMYLER